MFVSCLWVWLTVRYLKARSGVEALQLIASKHPHLVLLEAALPDNTGLDILQQLRQTHPQSRLPVIMLAARHNEKAIVKALDAGANDYVLKPFKRSEMLARIRMHLRSSQKAAAAAAAAAAVPTSPAALLAVAEEDAADELQLQQVVPAAEHLISVPLLVAELTGLEGATADLTPESHSHLLGYIADCFDALAEKYAVLKVSGHC
jgi:DNA-binding response OmpR family regulator